MKKVIAKDRSHLRQLIDEEIEKQGLDANLNHIDVSNVKSMDFMFKYSEFNGDISKWDVSNVKSMIGMFMNSKFNGDISKWDISNVERMTSIFEGTKDLIYVESCGENKRTIYLNKIDNTIVHIGCFHGTKDEAIEAISKKYSGQDKKEYINKIEELFMKRSNYEKGNS